MSADWTLEMPGSFRAIDAAGWDRLAHHARPEKPLISSTLTTEADSKPQTPSTPPDPKIHRLKLPDSSREAHDSSHEADDSSLQIDDSPSEEDGYNPFVSHAFLLALEESGCIGGTTGWTPLPLLLKDGNGQLQGALPLFAKSHSRGEYVFDHAFAEAYARAGGRYYPKLQISIPFTPATGPRLLIAPDARSEIILQALLEGVETLRGKLRASSVHATFLTKTDQIRFAAQGYLLRHDQQFHFRAEGFRDFEDFLASLASRKRKALKRERRDALAPGITVEYLSGKAITEAHWDAFFGFYMETGSRKWGTPYLNRLFFSLLGERMGDQVLLVMAKRAGRYIAGALNLMGANTLYGRYWGAIEHHPFLHFELCYYQAIDLALARGLARVEAGAQGEHKLARGYRPVRTVSAHRFADPGFHAAVANYLDVERAEVAEAQAYLEAITPYRKA